MNKALTAGLVITYAGVLRIAHVSSSDVLPLLDAHADEYPISAALAMSYSQDSGKGSYSFLFTTASMSSAAVRGPTSPASSNGSLLLLALDHHLDAGLQVDQVLGRMYTCIKGQLTGVLGRTWTVTEPLTNISYYVPNLYNINATEADAIRASLQVGQHSSCKTTL
jgi:hypothetical protein